MKKSTVVALVVGALVGGGTIGYYGAHNAVQSTPNAAIDVTNHELRTEFWQAWAEYTVWSRSYSAALQAHGADTQAVAERVVRSINDLGALIGQQYGAPVGQEFAELLTAQNAAFVELVRVVQAGDQALIADRHDALQQTSGKIVALLAQSNPKLRKQALEETLKEYVNLLVTAVTARAQNLWQEEIKSFDELFDHGAVIAQQLAERA